MTQFDFETINTATTGGTALGAKLNSWAPAVLSGHIGAARPSYAVKGARWTKEVSSTVSEIYQYDGAQDVLLGTINPTTHVFTPAGVTPFTGGNLTAALNEAKATAVASATSPNIWSGAGNLLHITGTTTLSGFTAAPQAGARRRLIFDGAVTLTHGANLILPGGANYTTAAGDQVDVYADTTTQFRLSIFKADGTAVVAPSSTPPVRQTVLSGAVDSGGAANFLSAGTGLAVNLSATAVPVAIAFAAGFGAAGAVDSVSMITADVAAAWSGLTAERRIFLYIDRNISTGALSFGFTLLAPVYGYGVTKSTAAYQYTYRIDEGVMYVGNGSAATGVQRVFVGECITGLSSVTSVTTYALQGRYDSGWFAVAAATTYTKTHALGVRDAKMFWEIAQNSDGSGWRFAGPNNNFEPGSGGSVFSATALCENSELALKLRTGSYLQNAQSSAGASIRVTSGYARATAERGW